MDLFHLAHFHVLLLLSSLLFLQAKGDVGRSVVFLDSLDHRFLRGHSTELGHESRGMLLDDISAAASVLLGFAPPTSLPKTSHSKLNELLLPDPFNRPRAVLMVDVRGIEAPIGASGAFGDALSYTIGASNKEQIIVPADENELAVIPIDEPSGCVSCLDDEFSGLAQLLGGTYVGTIKEMNGVLTFPLPAGASLVLRVSEQLELNYASSLASFVSSIKKAAQMHEDFSGSLHSPAELLMGTFTGIEALNGYGPDVAKKGVEVFQVALTKMFDLLNKNYGGKIVGIVMFNNEPSLKPLSIFDMTYANRASRFLPEVKGSNSTNPEVVLVRRSLAWITGFILIVATLIGAYLLLYMPLTRDTLLYANVKLD